MMTEQEFAQSSAKEIRELLTGEVPVEYILWAQSDKRKTVQQIADTYLRKQKKLVAEKERVQAMYQYETAFYEEGMGYIAGVDEVGRGPIAGPVTVAAVILPPYCTIYGLNDSKKIPEAKREELYDEIMEKALAVSIVSYDAEVIDALNIYQATKKAMIEAVQTLAIEPEAVLIDAMPLQKELSMPVQSLVKGDSKSASIAAASIVAKVTRDRYMKEMDKEYAGYGFADHKGYCTPLHKEALYDLGVTPIHRRSFEPVTSIVKEFE